MSSRRRRHLLALTAAVLAAHLILLRLAAPAVHAPGPGPQRALITRTVVIPAVPAARAALASPAALAPGTVAAPRALPAPAVRTVAAAPPPAVQAAPAVAISPETPVAAAPLAPAERDAAPALAFNIPAPVRLHYKVTARSRNRNWQAESELHWRHDGHSYEARLELNVPLLPRRTQQSTGSITAQGLAPLRFSDKGRSEEAAHFDRGGGKVSFSSNRPDAILAAGAQDRLSVLLQVGAMIAGDPQKFPPGTTIAIQTAGTRDAEPWQFTVEGEEALQLPGGAVNALRLTRHPRKEFDQRVELWLAPALDYVPVRLRLTQPNGDWVDQQWSSTDRG